MRSGEVVGTFRLDHEVARGGMGAVWRARDERTGDDVAVKLLIDTEPNLLARFDREAELLRTLDHPNIVRYLAHGATAAGPWLAMEWLNAEPLADRIAGLSLADAVAVCRGVAIGLDAAHRIGVIHRDIKPSNILLPIGAIEPVRLIDFGVARHSQRSSDLTRTGLLVGTPGYAAPEQIRRALDIDARCDLFALGCVLYLVVTHRPAFFAGDLRAALIRTLHAEPTPVRELAPDVPDALVALIERLLRKHPAARPASAGEVADALGELGELSTTARVPARRPDDVPTAPLAARPAAAVVIGWDDDDPEVGAWRSTALLGDRARRVAELGQAHGVVFDELCDGGFAATIAVDEPATLDRAARCALAIAAAEPLARIAIVSGAGPSAAAIVDRACAEVTAATLAGIAAPPARGVVRVDRAVAERVGGGKPVANADGMFDLEPVTGVS